jgi:hypothetical protein
MEMGLCVVRLIRINPGGPIDHSKVGPIDRLI